MVTAAWAIKEKMDKFDYIEIKKFYASKDIIKKVKDNVQNGRKNCRGYLIRI